ncbi:MAG TPA: PAS domain S-box protein [Nitrospira sp.]|nr:PAS domain S-box protein [Nitrospira sp.]
MQASPRGWIIAAAAAFIADLLTPLGYAVPMLYMLPILLTGLLPGRQITVLVVGASLLLGWIGVSLSPGAMTMEALTNRILDTALLFAIAWLLIVHKESAGKIAEAQRARDESEKRLWLAMSAEHFGTFDWNIPTQKVVWSAETERIWGLPVDGFEGTYEHWRRLMHPNDVAEAERVIRCSLDNPDIPYAFDHRVIRPNGTIGWIHAKVTTVRDATGRPIRMVGVNADITERKEAEEVLQRNENRFRTMAEAVPSFLFETDAAGWNIWTSDGWCRFTGQTHEQVAGHGWAEALHPDDRVADLDRWLHCMKTGTLFESKQRLRRVDGTYAWVIARALPVRDDHGNVTRWVGSVTDVDAIVRAEDALRESEKRFRSFFENAAVGAAQINSTGRFMHVNDRFCQITGYSRDELIGQMGPLDLDHPDEIEADRERIADFFREGQPYLFYEKRYVHKDGHTIWVRVTVAPIRDEQGIVKATAAIIEDITERKQAEVSRRNSEERYRSLFENMTEMFQVLEPIFDDQGRCSDFRYVRVNRATEVLVRKKREDMEGKTAQELFGFVEDYWLEMFGRVWKTGEPARMMNYSKSVDRYYDVYAWKNDDRTVAIVFSDITAYKRTEEALQQLNLTLEQQVATRTEALRESEERLRLAYQAARIGTFDWNLQTGAYTWTPELEALYGLKHGEFGRTQCAWKRLLHPDDQAEAVRLMEQAVTTGEPTQGEWRVLWPDGSLHWLVGRWQVFKDEVGMPLRMIGVNFDVTERKQAEDIVCRQWAKLEDLTSRLIQAQDNERQRIARDLHDDITQRLAALTIDLRGLPLPGGALNESASGALEQLHERAKQLTTDVQRLAHQLHPSILEHVGLEAAVRDHVEEFTARTGLATRVVVRRLLPTIPLEQATCLYRVLQESLQNVSKHANATDVLVRLLKTPQGVGLCVHDDGRGFEHQQETTQLKGLGLTSMAERVGILKGRFRIWTKPGDGTEVHASVPLEQREAAPDRGAEP